MTWGKSIGGLTSSLLLVVAACGGGETAAPSEAARASVTRPAAPPPREIKPGQDSARPIPTTPPATPPTQPPVEPGTPDIDLESLRLNQWQIRGTHNSYHLRPPDNPALLWQYDMPPISEQLEIHGIRALEFDVHAFPGSLRVFHLFEDPVSTCPMLADCLDQVAAWSRANPVHFPLFLFLEQKNYWTVEDVERVEAAVHAAFDPGVLFTPDDFTRGVYPSARAALQAEGWPSLGEMRGRIVVSLIANQTMTYHYTSQGSTLAGRAMFVAASTAGPPHVVILAHDYPIEQEEDIGEAVMQGFLVRTRSDQYPGQINDPAAMHRAALRSGAHILLTDYPTGSEFFPGYSSKLPADTIVRCNPVTVEFPCETQ